MIFFYNMHAIAKECKNSKPKFSVIVRRHSHKHRKCMQFYDVFNSICLRVHLLPAKCYATAAIVVYNTVHLVS